MPRRADRFDRTDAVSGRLVGMEPADAHLGNVLGNVALQVMTRVAVAVEAATGLSTVQATALSALANYAEGGSIADLQRSVDLSHSATVRLVDRLAELGLVERRGAEGDRRVAAIHLTVSGRHAVERLRVARQEVLDAFVATLPAATRGTLAPALDLLAASGIAPAPEGIEASRYVCRLCDAQACGHPEGCPVTRAVMRDR